MDRFENREESEGTFYQHSGEEFLFVYEDQLEFKSEGEKILLMPGDSLYFNQTFPHAVRKPGDDPASAVAVIYTPRE